MTSIDPSRPLQVTRVGLEGSLPYPLSDGELDGLHMKESMREIHKVRKFRRPKRFKPTNRGERHGV